VGGLSRSQDNVLTTAVEPTSPIYKPGQRVCFDHHACAACPSRSLCTRSKRHPRQLLLRPQERRDALQAARERQKTDAFKERYATRAGIEGAISQGVRTCALRRARYRGYAQVHLQRVLTAVALNQYGAPGYLVRRTPTPPHEAHARRGPLSCRRVTPPDCANSKYHQL